MSLTKERVCRLQLLLVLASAVILGSESRGTCDHILLSQIRDSPNLEGQVHVFISPTARLYPQALGSLFVASCTTRRATVEVFEPASTRVGFSLYSRGSDLAENISTASQRMSYTVAYSLPRDVFTESLPSNGSMRYII
jgi:hypothetical protein